MNNKIAILGGKPIRDHFLPFHQPAIDEDEEREVVETLRSGWLTAGPRTKQFEQEFARYVESKHAIAVNSGTAALHLALDAVKLQEGDEVITTPFTFASTAEDRIISLPIYRRMADEDVCDVINAIRKVVAWYRS